MEAYRDGSTLLDLAGRFQINRTTVIGHLKRRDVPRRSQPSMTTADVEEATLLYATGASLADVAEHMGFDRKTIRKRVAEAGAVIRAPRGRPPSHGPSDSSRTLRDGSHPSLPGSATW